MKGNEVDYRSATYLEERSRSERWCVRVDAQANEIRLDVYAGDIEKETGRALALLSEVAALAVQAIR